VKGSASILVLLLFLSIVLVSFPQIETVKAEETIYIREDGNVEGTDKIQREGNVYTFTDNINGEIVVEMDGIVVDGDSYTLQGIGNGTGIYLRKRTNVKIQNIAIKNFTYGIYLKGTFAQRSINNKILGNNVTDNTVGIILDYSPYNVLRNNRMANNTYNFKVLWDFPPTEASDFINDVDTSNTVDGKPIYYLINQSNMVISPSTFPDLGFLALVECTNMTVQNLDLVNEGQGLILAYTTNSLVTKNKIANNSYWGIILADSHNNSIIENYIIDNVIGIALEVDSGNNIISGNNITNNSAGVSFYGVSNNTISANSITNNNDGISPMDSDNNSIIGNTIMNNEKGIYFFQCYNNSIYNNSFINNTKQVYDNIWEQPWYPQLLSVNIWDNGTTGNYWNNYNGTDNDSDGIGDTPYIIDENNQDNFPLTEQFIIPEFPSWTPMLLILAVLAVVLTIYKRKLQKASIQSNQE
jgi:parallel beta-helix repeat protein